MELYLDDLTKLSKIDFIQFFDKIVQWVCINNIKWQRILILNNSILTQIESLLHEYFSEFQSKTFSVGMWSQGGTFITIKTS